MRIDFPLSVCDNTFEKRAVFHYFYSFWFLLQFDSVIGMFPRLSIRGCLRRSFNALKLNIRFLRKEDIIPEKLGLLLKE